MCFRTIQDQDLFYISCVHTTHMHCYQVQVCTFPRHMIRIDHRFLLCSQLHKDNPQLILHLAQTLSFLDIWCIRGSWSRAEGEQLRAAVGIFYESDV